MNKVSKSILGVALVLLAVSTFSNSALAAGFATATPLGKAHFPNCGAGGFFDLEGRCWKCPKGYQHDNILLAPIHDRVCKMAGQTKYSKGIKHAQAGVGCPAGQWPSLHDGFCYSCPAGFGHDILRNGDDGRVCFKSQPQQVSYSKGIRHDRTVLGLGCPPGQWPSLHNGYCYACPGGFGHDLARNGDDGRVCFRRTGGETAFRPGTRHDKSNVGLCPAGQWLSLHNMACYTCPGGHSQDVSRGGDDGRVCFQEQDAFSQATRAGGLLCDRGFFDPIDGGSCWSCPASHSLRTVAPVDGDRACTDRLDGIVAVDVCTPILTAVSEGQKGLAAIESTLQTIIAPAMGPLQDVMQRLTPQVGTPAELEKLIDEVGTRLRPYGDAFDEMQRLGEQLDRAGQGLRNLLLDPKVMCGGTAGEIDRRLVALGLRPNLQVRKAGFLDEWPVATAHAQSGSSYAAFFLAMNLLPIKEPGLPKSPLNSIVVTVVTNFAGKAAVFMSIGHAFSSNPSGGYSMGAFYFPSAEIDEFDMVERLGAEVSLNTGLAQRLISMIKGSASGPPGTPTATAKKGPGRLSLNLSFDPLFRSLPGFGFSTEVYTIIKPQREESRLLDFGGVSFDFSVLIGGG